MKYRLKYIKVDNLVFISHLDILNVVQRAFRRAGMDLVHSKGFNPHPKVHFAPPLPLFTSSKGEYMDVETKEDYETNELMERLNNDLPDNLQIIKAEKLEEGSKTLGKVLDSAIYQIKIYIREEDDNLDDKINDFIKNSSELNITKINKKGREVTRDIKPNIFDFTCEQENNVLIINTTLSLRINEILSPNDLLKLLRENFEEIEKANKVKLEKKDTILFPN